MIIFLCILGGLVAVISMAGGSRAYGDWAAGKVKSRVGAQLATSVLGVVIFIDDYFNCLTVGTVMRPVTDKFQISRAKLAYIIDATGRAGLHYRANFLLGGFGYLQPAETEESGMHTFVSTIPYNLYAILTIVMIIVLSVKNLDFGPMEKYQLEAAKENAASAKTASLEVDDLAGVKVSDKGRVFDLLIPIIALILFSVLAMLYTGGLFEGRV